MHKNNSFSQFHSNNISRSLLFFYTTNKSYLLARIVSDSKFLILIIPIVSPKKVLIACFQAFLVLVPYFSKREDIWQLLHSPLCSILHRFFLNQQPTKSFLILFQLSYFIYLFICECHLFLQSPIWCHLLP